MLYSVHDDSFKTVKMGLRSMKEVGEYLEMLHDDDYEGEVAVTKYSLLTDVMINIMRIKLEVKRIN